MDCAKPVNKGVVYLELEVMRKLDLSRIPARDGTYENAILRVDAVLHEARRLAKEIIAEARARGDKILTMR